MGAMKLKGKKVTVLGLGRSGLAAANFLLSQKAVVSISDCRDGKALRRNLNLLRPGKLAEVEIGKHSRALIKSRDLIIASPGIPLNAAPFVWANKMGIPVIGEIELAYRFCPAAIIAVTGTNGKTTVSTLIGEIFRKAGKKFSVCGNIGIPFSAELPGLSADHTVVLEISSFQLDTIEQFRPKVAVLLNLSADHLDRYEDFEQYLSAKMRIFRNQSQEDWAVINADDPRKLKLAAGTKAKIVYFSKDAAGQYPGLNSNHLAALAASELFGIQRSVAVKACRKFKGIAHRLEQVGEIKGVQFVNDSKATNIQSTLWALDYIKRPIILIAGGRDKGSDFSIAREKLARRLKAMVLLGEAREKIASSFKGALTLRRAKDLEQAVDKAYALARRGDCVLLSPMCASFDMFRDYAERGRVFRKIVQGLLV